MKYTIRNISALSFITVICFSANAQKLPSIQKSNVWAPSNVKIDGKSTEWNGNFQAHNSATDAFYTISNDDKNLYLSIYIPNMKITYNKVMTGGISFGVKNGAKELKIKYPAFVNDNGIVLPKPGKNQMLSGKEDDSIIVKDNAIFNEKAKELEVKGSTDVDTLISVFNEYGIKAAGRFDGKQGYLYELCMPLKYLGVTQLNQQILNYQISLNGAAGRLKNASMPQVTGGTRPDGTPIPQSEIDGVNAAMIASKYALYAPTNFSGQYRLALKP